MATTLNVGTLAGVLELDSKPFEQGVDGIGGPSGFGKIGGFAKTAGLAAVAALATAGVAAGAAFAKAAGEAMSIEQDADRLAASLGLSPADSARAGEISGRLFAGAYGSSLAEVNDAVGAVASTLAGFTDSTDADIERLSARALDFASIFDTDVATAVERAGVLVSSGLARDADHAFDLMTAGLQKVPTALRGDAMDALEEYSVHLADLGFTGEEAIGMVAAAAEGGTYSLDKAGDAIKEFGIRATDMSQTSRDAYAALGLDAEDMAAKLVEGGPAAREAFGQIMAAFEGIEDPVQREIAAVGLFGTTVEDLGSLDALSALNPTVNALGDVGGAAERAGDTLNDNFGTRLESLKRTAWRKATDLAAAVLGPIDEMSQQVLAAFQAGGIEGVGDLFADSWPAVQERLAEVGRGVLQWLRDELPGFLGSGAPAGLVGMLVANFDWSRLPDLIRDRLIPASHELWAWVLESVPPAIEAFGVWLGGVLDWLVNTGGPAFRQWLLDMAVVWAEGMWGWLRTSAGPMMLELGNLLGQLSGWIWTDAIPALVGQWGAMAHGLWGWITETAVPWLEANLPVAWDAFKVWVEGTAIPWLQQEAPVWARAMWDWITTTGIPALWSGLGQVTTAIREWLIGTAIPWLISNYPQWVAAIGGWILTDALPFILQSLATLANGIREWGQSLPGQLVELMLATGGNIIQGMWDGMTERFAALLEWVREAAGSVASTVSDVLSINSPSKVMEVIGEQTMQGYLVGAQRVGGELAEYWTNLAEYLARVPMGGAFKVLEDGSIVTPSTRGQDWFDRVTAPLQFRNSWHDAFAYGGLEAFNRAGAMASQAVPSPTHSISSTRRESEDNYRRLLAASIERGIERGMSRMKVEADGHQLGRVVQDELRGSVRAAS